MVGHPTVRLFDKKALKEELMSQLRATLDRSRAAHAAATEGATHSEARPENDKDTRGLELSYLACGQAQRVAELQIVLGAVSEMRLRCTALNLLDTSLCLRGDLEGEFPPGLVGGLVGEFLDEPLFVVPVHELLN